MRKVFRILMYTSLVMHLTVGVLGCDIDRLSALMVGAYFGMDIGVCLVLRTMNEPKKDSP